MEWARALDCNDIAAFLFVFYGSLFLSLTRNETEPDREIERERVCKKERCRQRKGGTESESDLGAKSEQWGMGMKYAVKIDFIRFVLCVNACDCVSLFFISVRLRRITNESHMVMYGWHSEVRSVEMVKITAANKLKEKSQRLCLT